MQPMQNAIGNVLAQLLDASHGDDEAVSRLTIKEVFAICRDKYSSINGEPISSLVDENMRKERVMLAQDETVVSRERQKILKTMRLGASDSVNRLSKPRYRTRPFPSHSTMEGIQSLTKFR